MFKNKIDKLKRKKKKGFTLIELLIVIAILAILGMILVPSIGAYRTKAEKSNIQASAKTLRNAIDAYNAENQNSTMASDTSTIDISVLSSASNDGAIDKDKLPGCLGGTQTADSSVTGSEVVSTVADLNTIVDGNFKVVKVDGLKSAIDFK